ncbi:MAG TPA: glycoside hydrolase family 3 N-terminal domain-containing protein [Chthoniobacterales bacterium]
MKPAPLGQLLLSGVPGTVLDPVTADFFRRIQPGGFILFGRNIQSAKQLRKLIDDLRDLSDIEPIITIDQEGGRVSRLKLIGNEPPNAVQLRDTDDLDLIRRHGSVTGRLLRLFGFNLDLCPVLDISFDDEADNSLRGRCYGRTVAEVITKAGAFNDALRAEGVASCGKHFPGYAAAQVDPHHDLPVIKRSRADLDATELAIFKHFAPLVDSMMVSHAFYPAIDSEKLPASLSLKTIQGILRKEHGFHGLVMTDDLDMGAILNEFGLEETIHRCLGAGNDLAMICHRLEAVEEASRILESVDSAILDRALNGVAKFKENLVPPDPFSIEAHQSLDTEVWQLRVDTLGPEAAAMRSPEDGKRSPVEIY